MKQRGMEHTEKFASPLPTFGRMIIETVRRALKTIWCVIAARCRYGIGRDDGESKLA